MNKITQSVLLATMLAASGFVVAQTPAAPADGKAPMGKSDRSPATGSTPAAPGLAVTATPAGTSGTTRAEVKPEAVNAASGKRDTGDTNATPGSKGSMAQSGTGGPTRAEVKAEAANNSPPKRETGDTMAAKPEASAAETKKMRDDKRAMAKAKRDEAKMKPATTTN